MAVSLIQITSLFFMVFFMSMHRANGHGYMSKPPMRSSMWRYGFSTPRNDDDNALWCGQNQQGRCGECGDRWDIPRPRPNDEGGKYGTGIIAANYTQAQLIDVQVTLTKDHGGFFEFRLCADKKNVNELSTDECFDKNLLQFEDGSTRFILGASPGSYVGPLNFRLRLPVGVSCQYCVLQWLWKTAANNNGCGSNIACGNQEHYKNCADIIITSNNGGSTTSTTTSAPTSFICPLTNGYYADPKACNGYYQCIGGTVVSRGICPAPAYFDSVTSYCHLPLLGSGCGSRPFFCPNDGNFQIPGTTCSSNYYNCVNGVAYDRFCPNGSIYNPESRRCEAASNNPYC